jgi:hypothetical protein
MSGLRWRRIVAGGLLIELVMFAVVLPLTLLDQQIAYYSVPFFAVATAILFGHWVAAPLQRQHVVHGALTALMASAIYVAVTTALAAPVPLLFHVSHGLRLLGGMLGGKLASRTLERS